MRCANYLGAMVQIERRDGFYHFRDHPFSCVVQKVRYCDGKLQYIT